VQRDGCYALLGLLPSEVLLLRAPKVAVGGGLDVDGALEVEVADDAAGAKVKVLLDDGNNLIVRLGGSAVGLHVDGQGLGHANGVGKLNQHTLAQTGLDKRLCHPAESVGSGAVHLGGVLPGEGATSVGTPPTVGVHDDLAPSQAGIAVGAANDKASGRVEVVHRLVI